MTNLIRSAKSGSDWTRHDVEAYNIAITLQTPGEFFGKPLPADLGDVDPLLATGNTATEGLSDHTLRILQYLDLASRANAGQESAIDDFAKEILRLLGFEERGLLLRSRYAIPLQICGDIRSAQTDICLAQGSTTILLIIQGDKTAVSGHNPEPQVIAEAIATFQTNNRARSLLGQPELDCMTIPCITMIGTRPIFYLVPVTSSLSTAVETGQYPHETTAVKKCGVASQTRRLSEGMEVPNFRKIALKHYVLFREIAKNHWSQFVV